MNNLARQKLKEIIIQYGRSLCDEPQRCEGLLRDLCGQYRKEIAVLVGALKERVPTDLIASQNSTPPVVLLARLTKKLQDNLGLAEEAARWAVESWALALEVISEADTASVDSSSQPPQVPPQYRQENINHTPITSNHIPSSQENVVPKKETDLSLQQISPTVVAKDPSRLNKANNQIKTAWIAGTISGLITLLFTFFLNIPEMFIDVLLIFGLTFGIYKKSRICAVIMFLYFILSKIITFSLLRNPINLAIAVLFIYFFWQGVQGTFAYHKITRT